MLLTHILIVVLGVLSRNVLCDPLDAFQAHVRCLVANRTAQDAAAALEAQGIAAIVHSSRLKVHARLSSNEDATPVVQMHGMGDFAQDPFGK